MISINILRVVDSACLAVSIIIIIFIIIIIIIIIIKAFHVFD